MNTKIIAAMVVTALALPVAAHAQGTVRGAEEGAREGSRAGGPIGEVLGGAVGAVTGTIGGILGVEERPRFHEYVVRERRPSYAYRGEFRVGTVLPEENISYYDVPPEYRAPGYRYTILNGPYGADRSQDAPRRRDPRLTDLRLRTRDVMSGATDGKTVRGAARCRQFARFPRRGGPETGR